MTSFSIEPDRTTYNTLLNLLAQSARFGKVFVFFPLHFFAVSGWRGRRVWQGTNTNCKLTQYELLLLLVLSAH